MCYYMLSAWNPRSLLFLVIEATDYLQLLKSTMEKTRPCAALERLRDGTVQNAGPPGC